MYFAALCRSIGIPARAVGGYQMIQGFAGTHFWAEYYLEGYGWFGGRDRSRRRRLVV